MGVVLRTEQLVLLHGKETEEVVKVENTWNRALLTSWSMPDVEVASVMKMLCSRVLEFEFRALTLSIAPCERTHREFEEWILSLAHAEEPR